MFALLTQVNAAVLASPLAQEVTYTPGAGAAVVVRGIFDALFTRVDAGEVGVSSAGPAVFVRTTDLPSDPRVDLSARVTADGRQYTIREVQPDGQGGVVLLLHEV